MDTIYIKDLEVFANHGVYPEENKLGQKFVISADLSVDVRMAGLTFFLVSFLCNWSKHII